MLPILLGKLLGNKIANKIVNLKPVSEAKLGHVDEIHITAVQRHETLIDLMPV